MAQRGCEGCGRPFDAKRPTARFCSATCRKRKSRRSTVLAAGVAAVDSAEQAPQADSVTAEPTSVTGDPRVVDQVRDELQQAGRLHTALGAQALRLAERMCGNFDTGSALASLSKELRAVMTAALANAEQAADTVDELAARRDRKARDA